MRRAASRGQASPTSVNILNAYQLIKRAESQNHKSKMQLVGSVLKMIKPMLVFSWVSLFFISFFSCGYDEDNKNAEYNSYMSKQYDKKTNQ